MCTYTHTHNHQGVILLWKTLNQRYDAAGIPQTPSLPAHPCARDIIHTLRQLWPRDRPIKARYIYTRAFASCGRSQSQRRCRRRRRRKSGKTRRRRTARRDVDDFCTGGEGESLRRRMKFILIMGERVFWVLMAVHARGRVRRTVRKEAITRDAECLSLIITCSGFLAAAAAARISCNCGSKCGELAAFSTKRARVCVCVWGSRLHPPRASIIAAEVWKLKGWWIAYYPMVLSVSEYVFSDHYKIVCTEVPKLSFSLLLEPRYICKVACTI